MNILSPDPSSIPPEMPSDPARVPPPDMPLNVPPEKGPGRPEPLPTRPSRPTPVARFALGAVFATALLASSPAWPQHSVGKDTSELEKGNPQQSRCAQISSAEERQRCFRAHQPSGAPATGKPDEARQPRQAAPGIGREMRPAPNGQTRSPTDPDKPAGTSR